MTVSYTHLDVYKRQIRHCAELSRFHIEPRNLRQYVIAANRESALFEQVLIGICLLYTSRCV